MYHPIYERFSFPILLLGQHGRILRHSRAMSGSAGLSRSRNRQPEGSTLSGYLRNSRKVRAGLVAGQAVVTAENISAKDISGLRAAKLMECRIRRQARTALRSNHRAPVWETQVTRMYFYLREALFTRPGQDNGNDFLASAWRQCVPGRKGVHIISPVRNFSVFDLYD